jgi:hypothetical protein
MAAVAVAVATFVSPFFDGGGFSGPELGLVLVDSGLFAALAFIALRSRAFWPMWAAGFQLCTLAGHMAAAKSSTMLPAAYADTLVIWSYAVMASLFAGTLMEGRVHRGRS